MSRVVILAGSNIGDRGGYLSSALRLTQQAIGKVIATSPVNETKPWGGFVQVAPELFFNQAWIIETQLTPREVLEALQRIETAMGRIKENKDKINNGERRYRSRVIDLDILFFDDRIVDEPELQIPHPRILDREFVLEILNSFVPEQVHPVTGRTIKEHYIELAN